MVLVLPHPSVTTASGQPATPDSAQQQPATTAADERAALAARQRALVRASLLHCPAPARG